MNKLLLAVLSALILACSSNENGKEGEQSKIGYDTLRFGSYYGTEFSDIVRLQLQLLDGSPLTSLMDDSTQTVKIALGKLTNLKPKLVSRNQNVSVKEIEDNRFEITTQKVVDGDNNYDAHLALLNTYESSGYVLVRRDSASNEFGYTEMEPFVDLDTTVRYMLKIKEITPMADIVQKPKISFIEENKEHLAFTNNSIDKLIELYSDSTRIPDADIREFLEDYRLVIRRLNDSLYYHKEYETYNTLIFREEETDPIAREFESQIINLGYKISSSEGSIYIDMNVKFVKDRLFRYFSPQMTDFFIIYQFENESVFMEDGSFMISFEEMADRAITWERFNTKYPDFEMSPYSDRQYGTYKYYLLAGSSHMRSFDYPDYTFDPENRYEKAYQYAIDKYPDSQLSAVLIEFLDLIEANERKKTPETEAFIKKHWPW